MAKFLDVLGTIANPIASLAGGLFSWIGGSSDAAARERSQRETNAINLQIARETNALNAANVENTNATNLRLAQEQNNWNEYMWNKNNQYNSPVNQVKLLKDAGLNPVMANGGASFQPASQILSADLANQVAPQAQMPNALVNPKEGSSIMRMQAREAAIRSATSLLDSIGDYSKKKQDIQESSSRISLNSAQIREADANIKKINEDAISIRDLRPYQIQDIQSRIHNQYQQAMLAGNTAEVQRLNADYRKVEIDIIKAQQPALSLRAAADLAHVRGSIRLMAAQRGVAISQVALNDATAGFTRAQLNAFDDLTNAQLRTLDETLEEIYEKRVHVHNENELQRFTIWKLRRNGYDPSQANNVASALIQMFNAMPTEEMSGNDASSSFRWRVQGSQKIGSPVRNSRTKSYIN